MSQDRNDIPQYQDGDDDDRYPNRNERSEDFDVEEVDESGPRTRKRRVVETGGRSWGKILLILLGVGAVSLALCCGGALWFWNRSFEMTEDPVKVAAAQKEIAEIQLLPNQQPQLAMKMNLGLMNMTLVAYKSTGRSSMMLMQMKMTGMTEEEMQQNFRNEGQKKNDQFQKESSETQKIKVDGVEREFLFAKGKLQSAEGKTIVARQITGMFPSRNGMGYLIVTIEEEVYDEAAVIQMIESIKK